MQRLATIALTLVLALQPFALCCKARSAGDDTRHPAQHHEGAAYPDDAPAVTASAGCTPGTTPLPALRERPRDLSPALMVVVMAAPVAGPSYQDARAAVPAGSDLNPIPHTTPLRL